MPRIENIIIIIILLIFLITYFIIEIRTANVIIKRCEKIKKNIEQLEAETNKKYEEIKKNVEQLEKDKKYQ